MVLKVSFSVITVGLHCTDAGVGDAVQAFDK